MEDVKYEEEFIVVDNRIKPFTSIPRSGVIAIREGKLDTREISVYVVMNMILDGMIKIGGDVEFPIAVAVFTGMTERQVLNVYKKLAEKGLLTIDGEHVRVNE